VNAKVVNIDFSQKKLILHPKRAESYSILEKTEGGKSKRKERTMKKRIIVCATVIVIISALISGCESEETRSNKMFECVGYNNEVNAKIVYDTETKVMYAFSCDRNMTLLVDENGAPKLWKGSSKND